MNKKKVKKGKTQSKADDNTESDSSDKSEDNVREMEEETKMGDVSSNLDGYSGSKGEIGEKDTRESP